MEFEMLVEDAEVGSGRAVMLEPGADVPTVWPGLAPPQVEDEKTWKWIVDRGDLDIQKVFEMAGLYEPRWRSAREEQREFLRRGARACVLTIRALRRSIEPPSLLTKDDEAKFVAASQRLVEAVARIVESSFCSTKGAGRTMDRLLARRDLSRERDYLVKALAAIQDRMADVRTRTELERQTPEWVTAWNRQFRTRFGHGRLRISADTVRKLVTRTPADVALEVFRFERFPPGTVSDDDIERKPAKMRVRRRRRRQSGDK